MMQSEESPMADSFDALKVQIQSGEEKVELQMSPNATVFHLAAEAQKALPLKEFPNLCRGDQELQHDSNLSELGIKNGDLLTVTVKARGVPDGVHMDLASDTTGFSRETSLFNGDATGGTVTPAEEDLGHAWKAPRTGAAWQAVGNACTRAPVSSPFSETSTPAERHEGEGDITFALREVIKKIVSPSGCGPQEVQELMSIAEDMEKVESEHAGMKKRLARLVELSREQSQTAQENLKLAQDSARQSLQLQELACCENGDSESPEVACQSSPGSREDDNNMLFQAMMVGLQQAALQQQQQNAAKEEEPRSFLMKRGDVEMQEAHQHAQQNKPTSGSITGSGVLSQSSGHMTKEEMDRARRAHAEKLERDQAERAKERQEAEAKSRSREALFNTPFAGANKPMGKF